MNSREGELWLAVFLPWTSVICLDIFRLRTTFCISTTKVTNSETIPFLPIENTMATPSSPKLPKNITSGIEEFEKNKLKHTEPNVKNTLPDESGLKFSQKEEKEAVIRNEILGFSRDNLKHADVKEKNLLPNQEAIQMEAKGEKEAPLRDELSHFAKEKLKHTETHEKNVMLDADLFKMAQKEEKEAPLRNELSNFSKDKLKHTETVEKNKLPDKQEIEAERKAGQ
ncbi:DgyrCDS3346 [Dimorphilus gyrociliatus]|uniref:DgyrCDS3346 n=2 Tax=Dimorphilus gyrociliatus TaxID=2664684 RepID=A0A7I8VDH5_9ANNE|nr:DgyrCDS3346 [Dimorphilus gyrociliatus]